MHGYCLGREVYALSVLPFLTDIRLQGLAVIMLNFMVLHHELVRDHS